MGFSDNTAGISVYILGIEDKKYLIDTYARQLGKASVTGYYVKFRRRANVDDEGLKAAILVGVVQARPMT